jgi:hypothetical protein
MSNNTDKLIAELGTYVSELKIQREAGEVSAIRGSTHKIFIVIGKLRDVGEPGIENSISMALLEAELDFDPSLSYRNICWHCYREEGTRRFLYAHTEKFCPKCGWLICYHCGRCRAPGYGGCESNSSST